MVKQLLNTDWVFYEAGSEKRYPAVVPGSVYQDLMRHGLLPDPYYRDNEGIAFDRMKKDYVYEMSFIPDGEVLYNDIIVLRFSGIDTIADVYFNDVHLQKVDNMHCHYDFPVNDLIVEGTNRVRLYFYSPIQAALAAYRMVETKGPKAALDGFSQIRKAHYMFGCAWGPRLPDAGIWKDVAIYGLDTGRIRSVRIKQEHREDGVLLHLVPEIKVTRPELQPVYEVVLTTPRGKIFTFKRSPREILVKDPMLWWPNGYGKQYLYTIAVRLLVDGECVDVWEKQIGLRTLTISREKDAYGESFVHEVNGVKIFAMGANYMPQDNILGRVTQVKTRQLLLDCKEANFNCLRVWGGGIYPPDYFFDMCACQMTEVRR